MNKQIYYAIWDEDGEESYILRSDECKPKNDCGDSDWWFDAKKKQFNRYWSFYDLIDGTQIVREKIKGRPLDAKKQP